MSRPSPPPRSPMSPDREVMSESSDYGDSRFARYDKMKTILPEGAVRQKMNLEGFSQEEIDAFFAGTLVRATPPPPPPPPRSNRNTPDITNSTLGERSTPSPRPPPPRPPMKSPTPPPPPRSASSTPISINGDKYAKYEKMKNLLPEGAVRQTMNLDGLSEEEINGFFSRASRVISSPPPPRPPPPPSPSLSSANNNPETIREREKATPPPSNPNPHPNPRKSVAFSPQKPEEEEDHNSSFQSVNNRVRVMSEGGEDSLNDNNDNEGDNNKQVPEDGEIKSFVTHSQSRSNNASDVVPVQVAKVSARRVSTMVPTKAGSEGVNNGRKGSLIGGDNSLPVARRSSVIGNNNGKGEAVSTAGRRSSLLPDVGKLTSQLPPSQPSSLDHHHRRGSMLQQSENNNNKGNRRSSMIARQDNDNDQSNNAAKNRKMSIVEESNRRLSMINMQSPANNSSSPSSSSSSSSSMQQRRQSVINLSDPSIRGSAYHARHSIFSGDEEVKLNTFDWKRSSVTFGDPTGGTNTNKGEETSNNKSPPPPAPTPPLHFRSEGALSPKKPLEAESISPSPKTVFSSFSKLFPDVQSLSPPPNSDMSRLSPNTTPSSFPSNNTNNNANYYYSSSNPFYQKLNEVDYMNKIKECLHDLKEQLSNQLQQFANYTMKLEKASSDEHLKDCLQLIGHPSSSSSSASNAASATSDHHFFPSSPPSSTKSHNTVAALKKGSPDNKSSSAKTVTSPINPITPTTKRANDTPRANKSPSSSFNSSGGGAANLTWNDVKQILRLNNMVLQYNSNTMKEDNKFTDSSSSNTNTNPNNNSSINNNNNPNPNALASSSNEGGMTNSDNNAAMIMGQTTNNANNNNIPGESETIAMKKQFLLKKIELELLKPKKLSQQRSLESAANSFEQYLQQYEQLLLHYITIYDNFQQEFIHTSYDIIGKEMKELDELFYYHAYEPLHGLMENNFNKQKNHLITIQQQLLDQGNDFHQQRMKKYQSIWEKQIEVMKEIQDQYNPPITDPLFPNILNSQHRNNNNNSAMMTSAQHFHQVKQYYLNKIDQSLSLTYEKIYAHLENDELFLRKQAYQEEIYRYKREVFQWKLKYQQQMEDRLNYMEIMMNGYYYSYIEELYENIHSLYEMNSKLFFYSEKLHYQLENLIYKHEQSKVSDEDMHALKHYHVTTFSSSSLPSSSYSSTNQGKTATKEDTSSSYSSSKEKKVKAKENILAVGTKIRSLAILAGLSNEETAEMMDSLYATTIKGKGGGTEASSSEKKEDKSAPHVNRNVTANKHQYHVKNLKKTVVPLAPAVIPAKPSIVPAEERAVLSDIPQSLKPFSYAFSDDEGENQSKKRSSSLPGDPPAQPVSILKTSAAFNEEKNQSRNNSLSKTSDSSVSSSNTNSPAIVGKKTPRPSLSIDSEAPPLTSPKTRGKITTFSPKLVKIFDNAEMVTEDVNLGSPVAREEKQKEKPEPAIPTVNAAPGKLGDKKNQLASLLAKTFANR